MSRQGYSGVTFKDAPFIAIGAGKSVRNSAVAASGARALSLADTREVISTHSGEYIVPDNAGEDITLVSTSAADAGVVILIEGLDTDFKLVDHVVTLDGTTPVAVAKMARVNDMIVISPQAAVGTVTAVGVANTFLEIQPGVNRSFSGVYSSPDDHTLQVLDVIGTMTRSVGNADTGASMYISYSLLSNVEGQWVNSALVQEFAFGMQRRGNTIISIPVVMPGAIDGPMDLVVSAEADAVPTSIASRIAVLLERK